MVLKDASFKSSKCLKFLKKITIQLKSKFGFWIYKSIDKVYLEFLLLDKKIKNKLVHKVSSLHHRTKQSIYSEFKYKSIEIAIWEVYHLVCS